MTFWGFPASGDHDANASPRAPRANRPAARASPTPAASLRSTRAEHPPSSPLTDNPTICTGQPLTVTLDVQTYQDPDHLSHSGRQLPGDHRLRETRPSNRSSTPRLTTEEADCALRPRHRARARHSSWASADSPSEIRSATVTLPRGPDDQPRRRRRPERLHRRPGELRQRGPRPTAPTTSKIGTFAIDTPALDGPLTGSLYFGEPQARQPVPALHGRRRLRHPRQARRLGPPRPRSPAS